jgi:hypothetical protein
LLVTTDAAELDGALAAEGVCSWDEVDEDDGGLDDEDELCFLILLLPDLAVKGPLGRGCCWYME